MPPRKRRIPVVFDTNVIIGFYLSRNSRSANQQVFRLWRDQRTLQLIVSDEMIQEYLEVLSRLGGARAAGETISRAICAQKDRYTCQPRIAREDQSRS